MRAAECRAAAGRLPARACEERASSAGSDAVIASHGVAACEHDGPACLRNREAEMGSALLSARSQWQSAVCGRERRVDWPIVAARKLTKAAASGRGGSRSRERQCNSMRRRSKHAPQRSAAEQSSAAADHCAHAHDSGAERREAQQSRQRRVRRARGVRRRPGRWAARFGRLRRCAATRLHEHAQHYATQHSNSSVIGSCPHS